MKSVDGLKRTQLKIASFEVFLVLINILSWFSQFYCSEDFYSNSLLCGLMAMTVKICLFRLFQLELSLLNYHSYFLKQ